MPIGIASLVAGFQRITLPTSPLQPPLSGCLDLDQSTSLYFIGQREFMSTALMYIPWYGQFVSDSGWGHIGTFRILPCTGETLGAMDPTCAQSANRRLTIFFR